MEEQGRVGEYNKVGQDTQERVLLHLGADAAFSEVTFVRSDVRLLIEMLLYCEPLGRLGRWCWEDGGNEEWVWLVMRYC